MSRPIQVEFDRGVFLPEAEVWLDPWEGKERAFVSHAHADHFAPHGEAICSPITRQLVSRRFRGKAGLEEHEFGERFALDQRGEYEAELLPAGHVLGSAQILIRRKSDGASLLYTGDFKLRPGAAAEQAEVKPADTLIMETTFGRPKYTMPPTAEVLETMVRFLREALEEGRVPMLGAYSLGKTQELLMALGGEAPELTFLLHRSAEAVTRVYEESGYVMPRWEILQPESDLDGKVLIAPPSALRSQQLRKVRNRITAMVTGWALDPGARFRYQVDQVFPLTDHADYPDLIRFVEEVSPSLVLTLHGFADEFAQELRVRGTEAWSLTGSNQMDLFEGLGRGEPERTSAPAGGGTGRSCGEDPSTGGEWERFAAICEAIAGATGRLQKVRLLSSYFSDSPEERLRDAVTYLSGRVFARGETTRTLQVGWAVTKRALLEASGRSEGEYRHLAAGQNDGGRTARLILEGRTRGEAVSFADLRRSLDEIAQARGPAAKVDLLKRQLQRMSPAGGALLVRLLSGELRIGLKEGLLEEALAEAFSAPLDQVRRAGMLTGDLGQTSLLARNGELHRAQVTPFVPLACVLASPEESAAGVWARLAESKEEKQVWLEDKYDGIRAQLHRSQDRVEIFSRDLRCVTGEFPELVEPAHSLGAELILDGEIIASAEGKRLTFFDLQKRLGRRNEGDLFLGQAVPVRFVAFDLLWKDGESFLDRPLRERRTALEEVSWSGPFELLPCQWVQSVPEMEDAFKQARVRGNEGLMAKDPESAYVPGKRGLAWLKLKKPLATLDCVVVKAQQGHGKRSHVLSDYTFSLLDERSGELVVLGKAYSGLTDREIEELTDHFRESTISRRGESAPGETGDRARNCL